MTSIDSEGPDAWFRLDKGRLEPEARERLARRMREAEAAETGRAGGSAL